MKSAVEKGRDDAKVVAPISHSSRRAQAIRSLLIETGRTLLTRCKRVLPGWLERSGA